MFGILKIISITSSLLQGSGVVYSLPMPLPLPQNQILQQQQQSPYSVLYPPAAALSSTDAFSNFAQHVYAVSSSIMGLSTATDANQIRTLANIGWVQEDLEQIEAKKMASLSNGGGQPLQSLTRNTPCILNGLQLAIQTPTPEVAKFVAQQMSIVRDSQILPNIRALGALSNAQNLITFDPVGPLLGGGIAVDVQPSGSQLLLQAQQNLNCA